MTEYGIGIVYGIDFRGNTPEVHAYDKLVKLGELLDSRIVERGIITGGKDVDVFVEYFVNEMGAPREKIDVDIGTSFVHHLYNIGRKTDRRIKNGEIPDDVIFHHIVQTWAVDRMYLDSGWVIPNHPFEIHGVEDARSKEEIWRVDLSDEPRRMKVDQLASKIPLLKYYPLGAQYIAYLRYPPNTSRMLEHLGRLLPI